MPQLYFVTLDVFTTAPYAGNPLAVVRVPADADVPTQCMQAIAREFNLSETIFVEDAKIGTDSVPEWRVRIFVTNAEIPFAGEKRLASSGYTSWCY